ncbi:MAG: RNA polymerase sigma factor RpoH [Legionellales bacterium]|nr:RNA polymerase sigma factor RpoH [Legionellales bacterium]|tara:strand:- start:21562 stop:22419 length:858 start_codon:yes stop_codon:yes gene_type:complete
MTKALQPITMNLPVGSIDAYIQRAHQVPMLSEAEEHDLAVRFAEHNDLDAARTLVMSHLRFVVRIARGYSGYGLNQADLIQEGSIGLMKAVKRFDPHYGVRLASFAVHWIKAEIHEFIIKNWRIVKIATTKAQRKLFFNLRNAKKRLGWFTKDEVEGVAEDLGVTTADVLHMEARLNAQDASFDPVWATNDEEAYAPAHYLEDKRANPEQHALQDDWSDQSRDKLYDALAQLDERSQDILQARWLGESKATLHELAAKYSVSAERIRQLEQNAMKKLKQAIQTEL